MSNPGAPAPRTIPGARGAIAVTSCATPDQPCECAEWHGGASCTYGAAAVTTTGAVRVEWATSPAEREQLLAQLAAFRSTVALQVFGPDVAA